jgi:hypothetical protein
MNQYFYLAFLLSILFFPIVQTTKCNSFPKIFGASSGYTWLYHIDVYNDYLAYAGNTEASLLTGKSFYVPFLVVSSISTSLGNYHWAKAFPSKADTVFSGV